MRKSDSMIRIISTQYNLGVQVEGGYDHEYDEKQRNRWNRNARQGRYIYVLNNPVRYTDPSGHLCAGVGLCLPPGVAIGMMIGFILGAICTAIFGDCSPPTAQDYFNAGFQVAFLGSDGITRYVSSRVKDSSFLQKQAERLQGTKASEDADDLFQKFINGNKSPGIGTKYLGHGIFYLRSASGVRVFMRDLGNNTYEVLGYSAKALNNEDAVITEILRLYDK